VLYIIILLRSLLQYLIHYILPKESYIYEYKYIQTYTHYMYMFIVLTYTYYTKCGVFNNNNFRLVHELFLLIISD